MLIVLCFSDIFVIQIWCKKVCHCCNCRIRIERIIDIFVSQIWCKKMYHYVDSVMLQSAEIKQILICKMKIRKVRFCSCRLD